MTDFDNAELDFVFSVRLASAFAKPGSNLKHPQHYDFMVVNPEVVIQARAGRGES